METTPTALEVRRLGRLDFATAHALQEELVERRAAGEITDQLLLVEQVLQKAHTFY